ncbi:MAG: replicative DNA helicase [Methylocystaceae bacterium]|nr:replicative DNA helicase [Methylocystaceae bacterium]
MDQDIQVAEAEIQPPVTKTEWLPAKPKDLSNKDLEGFRTPPCNFEAEKALIGALMANNKAYDKVSEFLRPEHFADPIHTKVFAACIALMERGQIADPITLSNFFQRDEELSEIGGNEYLVELAASAVTIINAAEYGRIIYDLYIKRELIHLGTEMVNNAHSGQIEATALDQIQSAEQSLFNLASMGEVEGGFISFRESLMEAINQAQIAHQRGGGLAGVTTGLRDLDRALGGLHRSDLLILAGRPSMGKTALVTCIAYNAAYAHKKSQGKEGGVVGFFSLEMSAEQLAGRILSQACAVNSSAMRKGEMSNEEFERTIAASQELLDTPLYIDDTPGLTISALRTRARRLKRQHGLDLIIVDYLQLVQGSPETKNNRVNEISEITRGMKMLAKELDVPVIALSQLSRQVEQREDKRPQLSDLRESGSIEQDADVVMFIYREFYYLDRSEPTKRESEGDDKFAERYQQWEQRCEEMVNRSEVVIGKQRHGPLANIPLFFRGEFTQFGDLDEEHIPDY